MRASPSAGEPTCGTGTFGSRDRKGLFRRMSRKATEAPAGGATRRMEGNGGGHIWNAVRAKKQACKH